MSPGNYTGISHEDAKHYALAESQESMWILICGMIVYSMQGGFAMLEAGVVRTVHLGFVLSKNILDMVATLLCFWLYAVLFSPSYLLGNDGAIRHDLLFFHSAFCSTSVTICSGSLAERARLLAYVAYSILVGFFVYPEVAESAWGDGGILSGAFSAIDGYPYHDFAGGGVVHVVGGVSALAGSSLLGRRLMRPEGAGADGYVERPPNGWPRKLDSQARDRLEFQPQRWLQATGTFVLLVGWFAFNSGSTLGMSGSRDKVASAVAVNTALAAVGGGAGAYIYACMRYCIGWQTEIDVGFLCNGILAGLVSITAGCDVSSGAAAVAVGGLAGLAVFPLGKAFIEKILRLDDPVDAIPVHFFSGAWGVLCLAFYRPLCVKGDAVAEQLRFCAEDFSHWEQFKAQLIGLLVIAGWAFAFVYGLFWAFGLLERVRAQEVGPLDMAIQVIDAEDRRLGGAAPSDADFRRILGSIWLLLEQSPLVRITMQDACARRDTTLSSISRDLVIAKRAMAETGLEEASCLVQCLAKVLYQLQLRYGAMLRLRIPPNDELNGVMTTDADLPWLMIRDCVVCIKDDQLREDRWPRLEDRARDLPMVPMGVIPTGPAGGIAAAVPSISTGTGIPTGTILGHAADRSAVEVPSRKDSKGSMGGSTCATDGEAGSRSSTP